MTKTVAVSPELNELREFLIAQGYDVVGVDETGNMISALIYSKSTSNTKNEPHNFENYPDISNNEYVLLINADEKTPKEIIELIEQSG